MQAESYQKPSLDPLDDCRNQPVTNKKSGVAMPFLVISDADYMIGCTFTLNTVPGPGVLQHVTPHR
ncbi:hypothetical protein J6590_054243 [Homalodisca vitripennis]|nr:hypothetical protein J6590_054243 [Homalodisca vitripennis]